jgi:ligand-binding SRPBCC domain-containing protein
MSKIISLSTHISAPAERCFLLSLSIDLHKESTHSHKEKAVAGVTSGLIKSGETVTWKAKHFGIKWKMQTAVSKYQFPFYFVSEMVKGPFKKVHHQHIFKENGMITTMTDVFEFEAPLGILGKTAEWAFLERHMKKVLAERNRIIKKTAQSDEWKKYLKESVRLTQSVI